MNSLTIYLEKIRYFDMSPDHNISICWFLDSKRFWTSLDTSNHIMSQHRRQEQELQLVSEDCNTKRKHGEDKDVMGEVTKTHEAYSELLRLHIYIWLQLNHATVFELLHPKSFRWNFIIDQTS